MTTEMIPEFSTIDVNRFRQLLHEDSDLRILDVRTGGEFSTVHIPGSFNVPLDTLGEHARDLASVEHPVVLAKVPYDRTDNCVIAGVLSELRTEGVRP